MNLKSPVVVEVAHLLTITPSQSSLRRQSFAVQERLVEPVECALVADICSVIVPGRCLLPQYDSPPPLTAAADLLQGLSVGHPRTPPPSLGYSLDVRTTGSVCVRLQEALLEEAKRQYGKEPKTAGIASKESDEVKDRSGSAKQSTLPETEGQVDKKEPESKLKSTPSILLRNETPVALRIGQLNTDEALLLFPGDAIPYTWKHPPGLVPGARKRLRVQFVKVDGSGIQKCSAASSWSDGFSLRPSDGFVRSVQIGSKGFVSLILRVCEGRGGSRELSVRGGLRFLNRTAGVLAIKYRGLMLDDNRATTLNEVRLGPIPKRNVPEEVGVAEAPSGIKTPSNTDGAGHWHRGERFLTVPSREAECDALLVVSAARDVSSDDVSNDEDCQVAAVSVLLGLTAEQEEAQPEAAIWSPWLHLDSPGAGDSSIHLLTVDTKSTPVRGVQRGLPCVWCQVTAGGPLTVTVWPLFMVYNGLDRALEIRVGEEGFETVNCTVKEREEVPLVASTSGVDSVSFRFTPTDFACGKSSAGPLKIRNNMEADGSDASGGVWSAPLLLSTEAPDLRTGKLASTALGNVSHIPPIGSVCQVVLRGSGPEARVRLSTALIANQVWLFEKIESIECLSF